MRVLALMVAVIGNDNQNHIVIREYELSSVGFMMRNTAKEGLKFIVRESLKGLNKGTRHSVKHEENMCHIQVSYSHPIAAYAFCDQEYPKRVAFVLLNKTLGEFMNAYGNTWQNIANDDKLENNTIKQLFKKYQNPNEADSVLSAQNKVNETESIMHDNIQKLLQNQGDLDELVAKSKDLSAGAKAFYKSSKQMNKTCCVIY